MNEFKESESLSAGKIFAGKRVLITGGTGLIGSALVSHLLQRGATISVITRNPNKARHRPENVEWLGSPASIDSDEYYDYAINLAGEPLAQGRWSAAKKQRLISSRLDTTRQLLTWVQRAQRKPMYLINASAVGFYGHRGDQPVDETDSGTDSFGHQLCRAWEHEAERFADEGVPVTRLRLGVVFDRHGGAFGQLCNSFNFKVATVMGNGHHYCSWVYMADLLRVVEFLLTRPEQQRLTGAVNATAPQPIPYVELARQLAERKRTLVTLHLPAGLLRLGLGEMAEELLLHGQRVIPARLQQAGFTFLYPSFAKALDALVR